MKSEQENRQTSPEELLREKLVAFQREIAALKQTVKAQEEAFRSREEGLFAELFEVLDALDNAEKNSQEQTDKAGSRLLKNVQAIKRKLLRLLAGRGIEPLAFADNRARLDSCRIVATQKMPGRKNEEILSIEKTGYMDVQRNRVLRKAEVVTVANGAEPAALLSAPIL